MEMISQMLHLLNLCLFFQVRVLRAFIKLFHRVGINRDVTLSQSICMSCVAPLTDVNYHPPNPCLHARIYVFLFLLFFFKNKESDSMTALDVMGVSLNL